MIWLYLRELKDHVNSGFYYSGPFPDELVQIWENGNRPLVMLVWSQLPNPPWALPLMSRDKAIWTKTIASRDWIVDEIWSTFLLILETNENLTKKILLPHSAFPGLRLVRFPNCEMHVPDFRTLTLRSVSTWWTSDGGLISGVGGFTLLGE